jgi:predicted secreted Zn-dependent protease
MATIALASGCALPHPKVSALQDYPSDIRGTVRVTYYDVLGRTAAEVATDLRRAASEAMNENVSGEYWSVGETRSDLRVAWRTSAAANDACSAAAVRVTMNVDIILPRWQPQRGTDSTVIRAWNRFEDALEVHESGHKAIAITGARDVIDRLSSLSAPCADFRATADRAVSAIVARTATTQQHYDDSTRHGRLQGVSFPSVPSTPAGLQGQTSIGERGVVGDFAIQDVLQPRRDRHDPIGTVELYLGEHEIAIQEFVHFPGVALELDRVAPLAHSAALRERPQH